MRGLFTGLLQVLFFCAVFGIATAQTIVRVPQDYSTIQAGINASANGDTVLVAAGTYVENINFNGRAITVKSEAGPNVTFIDGNNAGSVVTIANGEGTSSELTGFTIRKGHSDSIGGGIRIDSASPTINGNIIVSNQACDGGSGISIRFGSPVIQRNVITANTVSGCPGGNGGGGILVLESSTAQIIDNVIAGNRISGGGGGISLVRAGGPLVKGNIISANSSAYGGGLAAFNSSSPLIVQNLIANNEASQGGGVHSLTYGVAPTLVNNTIADNWGPQGSGIYVDGENAPLQLVNNIIVSDLSHVAIYCGLYGNPSPFVIQFNNVFTSSGSSYGICPSQTGINGNISAEPLFVNRAERNYHLQSDSPAIDAGTNSAPALPSTDIEGNVRISSGGANPLAVVDMGAYEYSTLPPGITVSPAAHDLGFFEVGSAAVTRTVTLSNPGTGPLYVSMIAIASADLTPYVVSPGGAVPCASLSPTLPAGTSCTLQVTFTPAFSSGLTGTKFASLVVISSAVGSPSLVSFTATVMNGDATPDPFTFAPKYNVAPNTPVTSSPIVVSGVNVPAPISVVGGEYSIDGGAFTNASGLVVNGQFVTVRVTSPALYDTNPATATLTIGGVNGGFSVSTAILAAGYAPLTDNASWSYLTDGISYTTTILPGTTFFYGMAVKQAQDSDDTTISYYSNDQYGIFEHGYFTPSFYVSGYGYGTLAFRFVPTVTVLAAQFFLGQSISSSGPAVYIFDGVFSFPYAYSTISTPMAFETITVPAGTFNALRIDRNLSIFDGPDVNYPVISVTQGSEWRVDGIGLVKSVFTTTDSTGSSTSNEVLISSSLLSAAPTPFTFVSLTNVDPGAQVASNAITVQGIFAGVGISITGGQYSIDGSAWTSAQGSVFNGQSVLVRQTASANYSTPTTATLTIGGTSALFSVTTKPLPTYVLAVQRSGIGTITSSPAGINCGDACASIYVQGTNVTLAAVSGSAAVRFVGWSGGGCSGTGTCTVSMHSPTTVTATFAPDTQPPSVPAGLTAAAVSGSQVNLAWGASTDNGSVTTYQVFRGGVFRATVNALAARFSDTGLAALTSYSYTVAACDAAGNCSAQSAQASATTLAAGQYVFEPILEPGFNLISNAFNTTLDVTATFGNQDAPVAGITNNVVSIWKWNAVIDRWAFNSPQLAAAANAAYAAAHNYEVLSVINPGEGYWVNSNVPLTLPPQSGAGFNWTAINFAALPSGFNLITTADGYTPSQFNVQVSNPPPAQGVIPTTNFVSLWAWNALAGTWYFYSPLLESSGTLSAVKAYADNHFYRHFEDYGKTIGLGTGFWVNRP